MDLSEYVLQEERFLMISVMVITKSPLKWLQLKNLDINIHIS
jgi:hypothetical protein